MNTQTNPVFRLSTVKVPPLEKLIFRHEDDNLDELRVDLWQWVMKNSFEACDLIKLDLHFIQLLAALAFLIQETDFTIDDADVFTCAYYDVFMGRVPDDLEPPKTLDPNAFRLAFKFLKMYNSVFRVLKTVGLDDFIVASQFDGMYYHLLYDEWKTMEDKEKARRLKEIAEFRTIYAGNEYK